MLSFPRRADFTLPRRSRLKKYTSIQALSRTLLEHESIFLVVFHYPHFKKRTSSHAGLGTRLYAKCFVFYLFILILRKILFLSQRNKFESEPLDRNSNGHLHKSDNTKTMISSSRRPSPNNPHSKCSVASPGPPLLHAV